MSLQDLSVLIKDFREEHRLTYAKFAERCGLSTATVWKIEEMCVKPDIGSIAKLAVGLGRTPEEVLNLYYQDEEVNQTLEAFLKELYQVGVAEGLSWSRLSHGSVETLLSVLRQVVDLEHAGTNRGRKRGAATSSKAFRRPTKFGRR